MEEPGEGRSRAGIQASARWRRRFLACGLLLAAACLSILAGLRSPARADTDVGPVRASGELTGGYRALAGHWGSSKFSEYRDLLPSGFGNGWLLVEDKDQRYFFGGEADYVGEMDQRYDLSAGRYNWFRVETFYEQFPHDFSNETSTLYLNAGSGNLLLPNSVQSEIQTAPTTALKSAALERALAASAHVDLEFRYRQTGVRFVFQPLPELEMSAGYRLQERQGTRPWSLGFGSPGNNFANVAGPIDERIHELTSGIAYNREDWNLQLNYLGSWYENDLDSLVVDNPLRVTDNATQGAYRGRISLAPDNSAHTLSLTGAVKLPFDFPARLTGTVGTSRRFQDEDFLPHTINSRIMSPALALPRNDLDGEVQTWFGNFRLAARPTKKLNITGNYRIYDLDNKSPTLTFPGHVLNDRTLVVEDRMTTPNDYLVQNADVEASYRLFKNRAKATAGFAWEQWDRDNHREVALTNEYIGKLGLDVKISDWAKIRAGYQFGIKRGSDYRTFAHLTHTVISSDDVAFSQSQSTQLRKYDEADRDRNQFEFQVDLDPRSDLSLGWTTTYTDDDYVHTPLGLTGYHGWAFGGDAEYRPFRWLTLTPFYTYELYQYEQNDLWRPVVSGATVDSPLNDWESTSLDRVFTAGAGANIDLIEEKLDLQLYYLIQHATGETLASAAAGQAPPTGADGGNAVNFPELRDIYHVMNATLNYHMKNDVTLHLGYSYERFNLTNFTINDLRPFMPDSNVSGSGVITPSTDIFLGNRVGNYSAHIMMLSASYRF
jgi:MtrB/PioB family decaheme-associated outer membrane protein